MTKTSLKLALQLWLNSLEHIFEVKLNISNNSMFGAIVLRKFLNNTCPQARTGGTHLYLNIQEDEPGRSPWVRVQCGLHSELKANLDYTVRPYLRKEKKP